MRLPAQNQCWEYHTDLLSSILIVIALRSQSIDHLPSHFNHHFSLSTLAIILASKVDCLGGLSALDETLRYVLHPAI